jgi:regulator of protease activity HflC (stomatin/prohibitin superfamily)
MSAPLPTMDRGMELSPLTGPAGLSARRAGLVDESPPAPAESWRGQQRVGALDVKTFMEQQTRSADHKATESDFTMVLGGALPWVRPNIDPSREEMPQFAALMPESSGPSDWWCGTLCCLTGVLAPYVCCKTHLVDKGRIGFSTNAGHPSLMRPGWNLLIAPWNEFHKQFPVGVPLIEVGPVTIVRVPQGAVGLATDNTQLQLLLPGTHARTSALFKFHKIEGLASQLVEFSQIRFVTVPTGFVRVGFLNGAVIALTEGRYAINTPVFRIGPEVDVRQENMKFSKHQVMLDGGVTLECEGLLTYQIVDPVLLTKNMGADDVERALQDTTKAELAKVFASVQLEQLSGIRATEINQQPQELDLLTAAAAGADKKHGGDAKAHGGNGAVIGSKDRAAAREEEWQDKQHEMTRMRICATVMEDIAPICAPWGVKIIKYDLSPDRCSRSGADLFRLFVCRFQLESTRLADVRFAADYEAATLAIAKAKATLKSNAAQNLVLIQQARAQATAVQIAAEGAKLAQIIHAQGGAEAMRIEADGRQTAASTMKDSFGRELAFLQEQVKMVGNIKATTLILGDKAHPIIPLRDHQK